jgi:hypothetical protein
MQEELQYHKADVKDLVFKYCETTSFKNSIYVKDIALNSVDIRK